MKVLIGIIIFFMCGLATPQENVDIKNIEELHQKFIYPVVRVTHNRIGGSGTIIRSEKEDQDTFCNYVLTNWHVVESAIAQCKEFDTVTKQFEDVEKLAQINVEVFRYMNISQLLDRGTYNADILTYSKDRDLALVMFRTPEKAKYVARLPLKGTRYYMGTNIYCVGSALGHKPVMTRGQITSIDEKIENQLFYLASAPSIYGNSGGAIFIENTGEFIGIPSRIDASFDGFTAQAITHLNYFIPIDEIYKTLDKNMYGYVWDTEQTKEQCAEKRKFAQERAKLNREINPKKDERDIIK